MRWNGKALNRIEKQRRSFGLSCKGKAHRRVGKRRNSYAEHGNCIAWDGGATAKQTDALNRGAKAKQSGDSLGYGIVQISFAQP